MSGDGESLAARLAAVHRRTARLQERRDLYLAQRAQREAALRKTGDYLVTADGVTAALASLSEQLFGELVGLIESKLSLALQEVLEQPIALKVERGFQRGAATLRFHVERDGNAEHILDGQGGSVANVLSVGLRLFALTTLPEKDHRRFLVLDEQDCWLRPDLVPKLVKIVHAAGKALGFQVLMISHHDASAFERYAEKIYRFIPRPRASRCGKFTNPRRRRTGDGAVAGGRRVLARPIRSPARRGVRVLRGSTESHVVF